MCEPNSRLAVSQVIHNTYIWSIIYCEYIMSKSENYRNILFLFEGWLKCIVIQSGQMTIGTSFCQGLNRILLII